MRFDLGKMRKDQTTSFLQKKKCHFFSDYLSIVGFAVIVFGLRQISRLQLFPASAAEMAESPTNKKTSSSSMIPDWTQLPEELLEFISEKLDNCFEVVHARSVCCSWRSSMPFPCSLLRPRYSLPMFPSKKVGLCSLEKLPFVLFRVPTPDADDADIASASVYFIGGISRDDC
ncbi:unnamed protein product [Microthlaspi erraticum]|uniref:F-box domain-containing protein n=1 Tax=Microthlaspi erraticum TaxID=1685480 RepID=A0A6D2J6S9_9BRAS|nr:unnamed protein product [Microthlaspi erraticum]